MDGLKPTPESLLAEMYMLRAKNPRLSVLIVEGETDRNLFCKFLGSSHWEVIPAQGKRIALGLAAHADRRNLNFLLVVIDADWDRCLGRCIVSDTIVYTDHNDMECTIIATDTLDDVARELLPASALKSLLKETGHPTLRALLCDRAATLGWFRLISERDRLSLKFRDLPFPEFLGEADFAWDCQGLLGWLRKNNAGKEEAVARLESAFYSLRDSGGPKGLDACCGHDLLGLMAVLSARLGPSGGRDPWTGKQIEAAVRLSFAATQYSKTEMAARIARMRPREHGCEF